MIPPDVGFPLSDLSWITDVPFTTQVWLLGIHFWMCNYWSLHMVVKRQTNIATIKKAELTSGGGADTNTMYLSPSSLRQENPLFLYLHVPLQQHKEINEPKESGTTASTYKVLKLSIVRFVNNSVSSQNFMNSGRVSYYKRNTPVWLVRCIKKHISCPHC